MLPARHDDDDDDIYIYIYIYMYIYIYIYITGVNGNIGCYIIELKINNCK